MDLIYGQNKSTVTCTVCKACSVTFDPFLITSLPIPKKKEKLIEL